MTLRDDTSTGREREYRGDAEAHDYLIGALARHRPEDAVLSEEGTQDPAPRRGAHRLWIVDPLDGSSGYGRGGDEWGVHVALVVDGALVAGAVALPARGELADSATVRAAARHPRRPRGRAVGHRQPLPAARWSCAGSRPRSPCGRSRCPRRA